MNVKERQIECVISTKEELEELVRQALITGVLHLGNCKINVDFNLAELLHASGVEKKPAQGKLPFAIHSFKLECPFSIQANLITFEKCFLTTYEDMCTHLSSTANFNGATFNKEADFFSAIFNKEASFFSTTFSEGANFWTAAFIEKPNFSCATFRGQILFLSATFSEGANFNYATFTGEAHFSYAIFTKYSSFKEITISENATLTFDHIATHDYLGIIPSVLNGTITITDPSFESEKRSFVIDLEKSVGPLALFPLFELFVFLTWTL